MWLSSVYVQTREKSCRVSDRLRLECFPSLSWINRADVSAFICLGPKNKRSVVQRRASSQFSSFTHQGLVVLWALNAQQEDVVCFQMHTHTCTLKLPPFMWGRMSPVWIRLFPGVTLDKTFNISHFPCPNSLGSAWVEDWKTPDTAEFYLFIIIIITAL